MPMLQPTTLSASSGEAKPSGFKPLFARTCFSLGMLKRRSTKSTTMTVAVLACFPFRFSAGTHVTTRVLQRRPSAGTSSTSRPWPIAQRERMRQCNASSGGTMMSKASCKGMMGSTDSGRPSIVTAVPFRIRLANTKLVPTATLSRCGEICASNLSRCFTDKFGWQIARTLAGNAVCAGSVTIC